jgi:chemotaxis protein CheX
MPNKKTAAKGLNLAPVLDLNEATALHGKLMALRGADLTIDASSVERVGAQCVQVLMASKKNWDEDKLAFKFSKVSDTFSKTMQLIGINIEPMLA